MSRGFAPNWTYQIARMANGMGYHALVYNRMAEYGFDSETFLLLAREQDDPEAVHLRFLDRRITLPVRPGWESWLWERGLRREEIRPLESTGIRAWLCVPNVPRLEEDIGEAIRNRELGP